jgi:glycosyltransferase involved in cell wall biosynthesis
VNLAEQLVKRGHSVTVTAQPGKFVDEEARKRKLRTLPVTLERQWDFKEANDIYSHLRDEKFDVVHVHWSTDYVVTPLMAKRAGVPVVVMSRHSPYPLASASGRFLYDRILFDRIIALSESVRKTLLNQGLRSERVVTIHHGTDTDTFRQITIPRDAVRADWGVPEDAFLVGLVGRVAEEKGWRTFLQALAHLISGKLTAHHAASWGGEGSGLADRYTTDNEGDGSGVKIYAVLIGEGPDLDRARALTRELGIEKRVVFAGFRKDVNNAMNALDVHVLASTWAEPCAAVVQQAMALGKPVIGTNIGGTPEMVAWGETGLLVSPEDAEGLASALADLYQDVDKRSWMGDAGAQRVDKLFTLRRMTDRNEALYYEVLQSKQAGAKATTSQTATR